MELDMTKYMTQSEEAAAQIADPDIVNYDLKAIVIHSGGPYGGHYWCYLKDDMKEGNWNLQMPEQFADAPEVIKPKGEENKAEEAAKKEEEEKKTAEPEPEEEEIDTKNIDWKSMTKSERKAMSKKI